MRLYGGIDLHSSNSYLGIMNEDRKRVFKRRVKNDPALVLETLKPYQEELVGVVVESTYNWYWLVDLLMDEGYRVHLANPSAIKKYEGLKHADDKHDAFLLAELLSLGSLPEGYIYPKEDRPLRDLMRKRFHLVKLRTSMILSLQGIISRNTGVKLDVNKIKKVNSNEVEPFLEQCEDLALAGAVSKDTIDFLTRQIWKIETVLKNKVQLKPQYKYLQTIPGVGRVLSLTIMLETGPIERFPKSGDYVSYCRKVPAKWTSNEKKKSGGNRKNGNRYLSWAYSEVSEFARRNDAHARSFFNRKLAKSIPPIAYASLSSKLARASYYIMRDQVPFDHDKLFGNSSPQTQ